MKSKRLLTQLIEYVELFEAAFPEAEELHLASFITFVQSLLEDHKAEQSHRSSLGQAMPLEVDIARHLALLQRYSKSYTKRALAASDTLQSEEEYSYLVSLISGQPLTKTELNTLNALEKTSGSEIIRRLVQKGLATEQPDERDRRSVLVSITPRGRAELQKVFPQLHLAASLLSQPLLPEQKSTLGLLLSYLCQEHGALYPAKSDTPLEELLHKP